MDPALIHLIYASAAAEDLDADEARALAVTSRARNAAVGVTGMLLHAGGSFFQVLEGPPDAVDAVFARISRDPRHARVTTVIREPVAQRAFGGWTMGFAELPVDELAALPALNDFFRDGRCLDAIDEGRARKLLDAFARGRWRLGGQTSTSRHVA